MAIFLPSKFWCHTNWIDIYVYISTGITWNLTSLPFGLKSPRKKHDSRDKIRNDTGIPIPEAEYFRDLPKNIRHFALPKSHPPNPTIKQKMGQRLACNVSNCWGNMTHLQLMNPKKCGEDCHQRLIARDLFAFRNMEINGPKAWQ